MSLDPREILIVRFGSLGDLCLLGWALARLADRPGAADRQVTLVTKSTFAPLVAKMRGIHAVIPLPDSGTGAVIRLAGHLRRQRWDLVLDAHNILRGHILFAAMGRRPNRRLAKDTVARLAFMRFGRRGAGLNHTMHDRFEELTAGLASVVNDPNPTRPPLTSLSPAPAGPADPPRPEILGLAPGAQWDTKRWPQEYFVSLVKLWLEHCSGTVRLFLGPREENWFTGGALEKAAQESGRIELVRGRSLVEVAHLLSECHRLVTNDSGLLHVAEAVGTPVLAFFGPTVREFGYYPVLTGSRVLETSLDCRPCSRNGKRPCHRGDLACLRDIKPETAFATLNALEGTP